jgi:hypothetical protein
MSGSDYTEIFGGTKVTPVRAADASAAAGFATGANRTARGGNSLTQAPLPPHHPTGTTVQNGAQPPAAAPRVVNQVKVPVMLRWKPGDAKAPVQYPLVKPLEAHGHNTESVVLTKVELLSTTSNAPSTLQGKLSGLHNPKTVATAAGGNKQLWTTDGQPFNYIIPPGHHTRNEVLYLNELPADNNIDLASHAAINVDELLASVDDPGQESTHVQVTNIKAPVLYGMIERNRGSFATLEAGTIGNVKTFNLSRDELKHFIEDYDKKVQSEIWRTKPQEHQATLSTWAGDSDDFGRTVAQSAAMVNVRDEHVHPDVQHEVVAVLQYSYLPTAKTNK